MNKGFYCLIAILFSFGCQTVGTVVTEPLRGSTDITQNWKIEKGEITGVDGAEYRIYTTGPNPQKTLIFNHGYLDDVRVFEQSLHDESGLRQLTSELGSVRIVVISYGMKWMLTPQIEREKSPEMATIDTYSEKILPQLEEKYGFKGPHILVGRSMGASNAASLCAAKPDLWSKCVLLNPMLIPDRVDPFQFFGEQWKASFIIKSQYQDLEEWQKNRPSALLGKATKLPKTFITACKKDGFDLFPGSVEWTQQAKEKGFDITWSPIEKDCDHQVWPTQEVANFIKGDTRSTASTP